MKLPILFLTFLAASCGDYSTTEGTSVDRIGDVRSVSTTDVSETDRNNIVAACNALVQKASILNSAINSRHTFSTSQTDCEGNTISSGTTQVVLQSTPSGIIFQVPNNGEFLFPVIETGNNGIMGDICGSTGNLVNPIVTPSEITYFTTIGVSSFDCKPVPGEVCVRIEKATPQGTSAVVHTKEWLRIRVSSPDGKYIGFVTDRKKVTRSFCGVNEVLTFKATLQTN